jgi:hypothetical protein
MKYSLKRWLFNYKLIVADFVTGIGLFWLVVEISSYSTDGDVDRYLKSISLFSCVAALIFIFTAIKNAPKTTFSYKLRDKDNFIEVKVGDAFSNGGSLVIPFNNYFDVSLGGNVKKANSLQNQLIKKFYSDKEEHLETDISKKIDLEMVPFEIGTVVEVEQKEKMFYLLVNSTKKPNNRVESTTDDFLLSLSKLWTYIALESGRNSIITIPLISTAHGRITNINRQTAIKEIIESYIESSKLLNIADKLIISIHPNDLKKGEIDLDEIDDFLRFSCSHYKIVKFSAKVEGQEDSPSSIESISR